MNVLLLTLALVGAGPQAELEEKARFKPLFPGVTTVAWNTGNLVAVGNSNLAPPKFKQSAQVLEFLSTARRFVSVYTPAKKSGDESVPLVDIVATAFSPNGKILAFASADGAVRLWATGKLEGLSEPNGTPTAHAEFSVPNDCLGIAWGPRSEFVAALSRDGTLSVQQVTLEGTAIKLEHYAKLKQATPVAMCWLHGTNPRLAIADKSGNVRLWQLPTASEQKLLPITLAKEHGEQVIRYQGQLPTLVASDLSGEHLVVGLGSKIEVNDRKRGKLLTIDAKGHTITSISVRSKPLQVVAGTKEKEVIVWDGVTGEKRTVFGGDKLRAEVTDVSCSASNEYLAIVDRTGVLIVLAFP